MKADAIPAVELVPVDQITVVNPRVRNKKVFREIVANIEDVGLKRPITVARRNGSEGPCYELVCGQGRLEAYRSLGQKEIPALVVEADSEDCLVMSLVENLARRQHRAIDLLHDIEGLKRRGYGEADIADKTGLTLDYVRAVIKLLENGELKLLRAVESGLIPVSIAVEIADADDAGVQQALQQAYESKQLRGRKLLMARRLVEQRHKQGKGLHSGVRRSASLSSNTLVRAYRDNVDKKRSLVRKSELTRNRLTFVTEALRKLVADENFVTLLRAEGLDTMPKNLADRLRIQEAA
ncbi:MAG: plasmid partitioning protein RepB C-terminal domain-containing protein [Parvibaculum sp.]|uniref:plasmid partitioning protein RepB C-terminal domain-containing protein n=1 Tax=Parvibaculum sp. TaxID=2024848 RepID=UPI002850EDF6|nr:plasmid partitioning protein RepB C-terminal domain-containing protein [Parvibaculum sp.]MDR3500698.1 plasmid partitioning protein RepB C-terminal domain-containing protein [Parvibaculum sp.]